MGKRAPDQQTGHSGGPHDYLPAFSRDALLPFYDLMSRVLGVSKMHRTLIDLAELTDSTRTLEIGCGTGNLTLMVKRRHPGIELVGIDPDPLALARATRKASGLSVRFDRGYSQALPYPDESFDRVLSAFMLHHLDSDVRNQTAKEVLRVLHPDGALYLLDMGGHVVPSDGFMARRQLQSPRLRDNMGDGIPNLLLGAGFTECAELASRKTHAGRMTFYRASRAE
jgi:ubiquinone/menaquinone biosynthesis C-methylase UbiE